MNYRDLSKEVSVIQIFQDIKKLNLYIYINGTLEKVLKDLEKNK